MIHESKSAANPLIGHGSVSPAWPRSRSHHSNPLRMSATPRGENSGALRKVGSSPAQFPQKLFGEKFWENFGLGAALLLSGAIGAACAWSWHRFVWPLEVIRILGAWL